jgi:hypothetical protein
MPTKMPTQLQLQIFGRNKKQTPQETAPNQKPKKTPKIKATPIGKYELSEGTVTFSALNGTIKKKWVKRGEFFLSEITHVETVGNIISITRGATVYNYVHTAKTASFKPLEEQILAYLSQEQTTTQNSLKIAALKTELAKAINASIPTVDLCFDVLAGLNQKRVNWITIEETASKLGGNINFSSQTLAPLNVDLSKIPLSVKSQVPKDVTADAMAVLKSIYGYFDALTSPDGLLENTQNVYNTKKAMLAYYTVNDVLLAKVTGQKDDEKELSALDTVVLELADKSSLKISLEELKTAFNNVDRGELGAEDVRAMFRVQLRQF